MTVIYSFSVCFQDLILTSGGEKTLSPHTSRIVVNNCTSVVLQNSSLSSMTGLRSIDLINIANLSLMTQSFKLSAASSRARISIRNASIEVLPSFAFHGDVESISFENVRIGQMNAFAFANLADTDSLRLEDCTINAIEEQAFKKFDVNYLRVIGGSFGSQVPSRTMNDIEVSTTFVLDGVTMGVVRSSAFVIKKPKTVAIQNCIIESLESEAFVISTRGAVLIKNNTFGGLASGAFLGIRADSEEKSSSSSGSGRMTSLPDISFTNNSLSSFEEGSVMFDRGSFRPVLENVFVNRSCECSMLSVWKNNVLNYTNVYSRFYTAQNGQLAGSSSSPPPEPIEEGPETFLCYEPADNGAMSFGEFEARNCALASSVMLLALVLVGLLVFFGSLVVLVVWCCRRRRNNSQKRWISVPTSAPDIVTSKKNGVIGRDGNGSTTPVDSRITMVVPDGRLYRETEFHVIVEKAEPLTTEL